MHAGTAKQIHEIDSAARRSILAGEDQYREVASTINGAEKVLFCRLADVSILRQESLPFVNGEEIRDASKGGPDCEVLAIGKNRGRILTGEIRMKPEFIGERREIRCPFAFLIPSQWISFDS